MAHMRRRQSPLWRILLAPAFCVGVWQTEAFRALFVSPSTSPFAAKFLLNWLFLGACFCGLLLAVFAGPRKRPLLACSLILWLSPLWTRLEYASGAIRGFEDAGALAMLLSAPAALWGLMAIRAARGREWSKTVLAMALCTRVALLILFDVGHVRWLNEMFLVASAISLGTLIDWTYAGFAPGALPALVLGGGLLPVAVFFPNWLESYVFLWGYVAACALNCAALLFAPGGKRRVGHALALVGAAMCAVAFLATGQI